MKLNNILSAILFVCSTLCITATQANACTSLMGGCTQEPAHDTASHMKSQIVNKVEKSATSTTATASTKHQKTKILGAKKTKTANLAQVITKQVLQ